MSIIRNIMLGGAAAVVITAATVVAPTAGVEQGSPTPFPTAGTVPVVTASPSKSSVRSSGEINKSAERETRESSVNAPYGDAESVRKEAQIIASNVARLQSTGTSALTSTAKKTKRPKPPPVNFIKGYSYCGSKLSQAQRCIDQGKLTLYFPSGVNTLAGHNYKGWYWIDDIPNGHQVVIAKGRLKGTYKVYGHAKVYDKKFPRSGRGADLALQTCEGSGIGFSFLRRI